MQKSSDLQYGMFSEDKVEPMINQFFCENVLNTKLTRGKYCPYDYESADMKTRYELKSRKINHNQFPTILISHRKIIKGSSNGCDLVLLFLFLDGLYFIRYEPMLFSNFDIGDFVRYRDGQGEKDTVIHIPIKHLTKINL
tara:strand:- start:388 stop:807 length:420 start_codon:yes stop_codon:yes gene_type:complete